MVSISTVKGVRDALSRAKGPNRELDNMLAKILIAGLPDLTPTEHARVQRMAFTRGVEQADRFCRAALSRWDWSVGSYRGGKQYHAILWAPDHSDFCGNGPTPALALLIGALNAAIYHRRFYPAPAMEARRAGTQGGPVHDSAAHEVRAPSLATDRRTSDAGQKDAPKDQGLGPQVREFDETFSAFAVLRDHFRFKSMSQDGRPEMPSGYEAALDMRFAKGGASVVNASFPQEGSSLPQNHHDRSGTGSEVKED